MADSEMGKLDGKVVLISGAARGQGRAHAIAAAEEGADVIAFDVCAPVAAQGAPAASEADLDETRELVEKLRRRIVTATVDVRDHEAVTSFISSAVEEMGRLDVVIANAGINGPGVHVASTTIGQWRSVIDTNLTGAFSTISAALPTLIEAGRGGSIVLISSSLALRPAMSFGAYSASKHGMVGLMQTLAVELAEHSIRVNCVHPTGVNTDLLVNESTFRLFRPDLENPQIDDVMDSYRALNLLPVPWVEAEDVANMVMFLASDAARYVTGASFPLDAGMRLK